MCEYFAGDDVRAWEPDCAGSSAFRTAAEAALAGAPCEDGLQALVDDLTTVCNRVDNSWTTVRCVPTEEATEANVAACNAVAAPTSAGDCTAVAECEYLDPSTLKSVWEGWGCVDGTVAETACPVKCQAQIDHYCKPKGTCRPPPPPPPPPPPSTPPVCSINRVPIYIATEPTTACLSDRPPVWLLLLLLASSLQITYARACRCGKI
jgi:hypothetical protein